MIALVASALAAPVAVWDLEEDDGGFVEDGELLQWQWGAVTNGPASGWDGANAWSTGLTRDYLNDSTDTIEVPLPSLAGLARPVLRYHQWYELGSGDAAWVEIAQSASDGGNGWTLATPSYGYPSGDAFTGASAGWEEVVLDLRGYGDAPRVRLVFYADPAGVAGGWTVDGFELHDGDVAAPQLGDLTSLEDTEDLDGPYVVEVDAEDDVSVSTVTLAWSAAGEERAVAMTRVSETRWLGEIPGQAPGTTVRYRVVASDGLNESALPAVGAEQFRVRLPAPTGLAGPEGRWVGTSVPLTWTAPESTHEVLGYEVLRGGQVVAASEGTSADVPLSGEGDTFSVRAIYEAGAGDASDEVTVDAVVPELDALSPAVGWPGETLRVEMDGAWLLLVQGDAGVALGDGVTVTDVDVRDVDGAWLTVAIDADAVPGPRALSLETSLYDLTLPDAFTVADGDERPRILSVEPDSVRQGETAELTVSVVGDLAAVPTVDLGEGFVVTGATIDGDVARVEVACANDAPVGAHAVRLDDGVRVFEGGTITVEDTTFAQPGTCGTAAPASAALVGLSALLARRRR